MANFSSFFFLGIRASGPASRLNSNSVKPVTDPLNKESLILKNQSVLVKHVHKLKNVGLKNLHCS